MSGEDEPTRPTACKKPVLRELSRSLVEQAAKETVEEAKAQENVQGSNQEQDALDAWNPDQVYQRALNWVGEEIQGQLLEGFLQTTGEPGTVDVHQFIEYLRARGLNPLVDPRLKDFIKAIRTKPDTRYSYSNIRQFISHTEFKAIILNSPTLLAAIKGEFVVEDFPNLVQEIDEIFDECRNESSGEVTTYIPTLAHYDADKWAVALCTIDGQVHCCGDADDLVTLQSVTKPLFYGICLDELGEKSVHEKVGKEPSGYGFNKLALGRGNKAHNPLINTGAITLASVYMAELPMSLRFQTAMSKYQALGGGATASVNFNNTVYLSEVDNGHRNYAIVNYLKSKGCLDEKVNLKETMELYFQMCSIETSVKTASIIAGALANGGRNVFTGEQVISERSVQNVLSIMFSCGMYDYSGEWAFEIGLPAKSGVSGLVIIVIPDVMGVALWSPPLDTFGNSVRSVRFGRELVARYSTDKNQNILHPFSNRRLLFQETGCKNTLQNTTFPPFPVRGAILGRTPVRTTKAKGTPSARTFATSALGRGLGRAFRLFKR